MKNSDKNILTFEQLKKLIAESLYNEPIKPLDISKAIKSGNYKLFREPGASSDEIFTIYLYQKNDDRLINLCLNFRFRDCDVHYFYSDEIVEDLWRYTHITGTRSLIEITSEFENEIESNEDLKELVVEYMTEKFPDNNELLQKKLSFLNKIYVYDNNSTYAVYKRKHDERELEKRIHQYADKRQKELNRKYHYYKEYYRGSGSIAHDDDYAGSGEISLGEIAVNTHCKTEEDIEKLIEQLHKTGLTRESGNYRTFYTEIDNK